MSRWAVAALLSLAACREKPNDDGMIAISAAALPMGCRPARDPDCGDDERPEHVVQVAAFRIDRTEVTQEAYAACVKAGACVAPLSGFDPTASPKRPVTNVTWADARAYCEWRHLHLPTEPQWELAARGTDGRLYPWGDAKPTCTLEHTYACGATPVDVATHPAGKSPYGVHDLAGNVDEWVEEPYRYYESDAGASGQRTARGGAYDAWHTRSTARSALAAETRDPWVGFRCAGAP